MFFKSVQSFFTYPKNSKHALKKLLDLITYGFFSFLSFVQIIFQNNIMRREKNNSNIYIKYIYL